MVVRRAAGMATGAERAAHFVRLWTLKEAYVKALGRGIGAPPGLRGFTVTLAPAADAARPRGDPGAAPAGGAAPAAAAAWGRPAQPECARQAPEAAPRRAAPGAGGAAALGASGAAVAGASAAHFNACGAPSEGPDRGLRIRCEPALDEAGRCEFALLAPSAAHVAALCLRRRAPGAAAGAGGGGGARGACGAGGAPALEPGACAEGGGGGGGGLRVRAWRTVPLVADTEQPVDVLAVSWV
jgi:hypothetical protein